MVRGKELIGKKVRITSDNPNYYRYLNKELIIIESFFQEDRDEEPIFDLEFIDTEVLFPFSLYEWEFEVV